MKKDAIQRTGSNGRTSHCVAYNGQLYISGVTPVDIEGDITAQAKDVFEQMDRLLSRHSSDKHMVLKADVILQSMEDYGDFNQAWDEWVTDDFEPTRSICAATLPLSEYRVMLSLVAAID